jgi:competence protein ComGE
MLRNNNGFFLLELLLSLSALFMICIFFIPLLMDLNQQSRQLEADSKARQLMYEELQAKIRGAQTFTDYFIEENSVKYQIIWRDSGLYGQKEVCVKVEQNSFLAKTEICGALE